MDNAQGKFIHKANLSPKSLFDFLKKGLIAITKNERKSPDKNIKYLIDDESESRLSISWVPVTDKELQAFTLLRENPRLSKGGQFTCPSDTLIVSVGSNSNEEDYVSIHTMRSDRILLSSADNFSILGNKKLKNFMYYGNGIIFCKNEMSKNGKIYPCTMKDLFEGESISQRCVCLLIMEFFSKEHLLWRDLATDFLTGSAYSSITLPEIWQAHSREELLRNHYGVSLKRNNRETIGQGIFLIQAARLVKESEMQKLYGFNPGRVYIGRKKEHLVSPIADYIIQNCPNIDSPVRVSDGHYDIKIDKQLVEDAIHTEILLRRKFPISFRSPRGILNWHDESSRIFRSRGLPTVRIPKNSIFKNLKMPPDCVRLTSRRQFYRRRRFSTQLRCFIY